MFGYSLRASAALVLTWPVIASADTQPPPHPVLTLPAPASELPDHNRLVVSRQIMAIIYAPDRASEILGRFADSVAAPIVRQTSALTNTKDPDLIAIYDEVLKDVPKASMTTLVQTLPDLSEAMARAYARQYSQDELLEILAFSKTPAGKNFLTGSDYIAQDVDVQAYYYNIVPKIRNSVSPIIYTYKAKLRAYLAAHPGAAKAMADGK